MSVRITASFERRGTYDHGVLDRSARQAQGMLSSYQWEQSRHHGQTLEICSNGLRRGRPVRRVLHRHQASSNAPRCDDLTSAPLTTVARLGRGLRHAAMRLALPEVCAGCGISGWWVCPDCSISVRRLAAERTCIRCGRISDASTYGCSRCSSWSTPLLQARSIFMFEGTVRASIHRLKYRNEPARAEWCAAEMAADMPTAYRVSDVLIPVPLHPVRLRSRGYNQSDRTARALSNRVGIMSEELLERTRPTTSQVELSAEDRWVNVTGAFRATRNLSRMNVLLIDDVMTTGATLHACAVACVEAGAEQVRSLTVATES